MHHCLRLVILGSHISAKRVVEVLYLPREVQFAIQRYPGFIAENLYNLYINNWVTPIKSQARSTYFRFLKNDLLNVTLFNQKCGVIAFIS